MVQWIECVMNLEQIILVQESKSFHGVQLNNKKLIKICVIWIYARYCYYYIRIIIFILFVDEVLE